MVEWREEEKKEGSNGKRIDLRRLGEVAKEGGNSIGVR